MEKSNSSKKIRIIEKVLRFFGKKQKSSVTPFLCYNYLKVLPNGDVIDTRDGNVVFNVNVDRVDWEDFDIYDKKGNIKYHLYFESDFDFMKDDAESEESNVIKYDFVEGKIIE